MANEKGNISFLAAVARAREAQGLDGYRRLSQEEVTGLEAAGNVAEDWSKIYVKGSLRLTDNPHRIVRCFFYGRNLLSTELGGHAELRPGVRHAEGLYESTFINCVVGPHVLIKGNSCISSVVIEASAKIIGCGTVACTGSTTFSVGSEVHVGAETDARPLVVYPEVTVGELLPQAMLKTQQAFLSRMASYTKTATSECLIVSEHASLLGASKVIDSFIGPWGVVEDSVVEDVTMLSSESEPTRVTGGSYVSKSILQWSAQVASGALVRSCMLMEHSSVQDKAVVSDSPPAGMPTFLDEWRLLEAREQTYEAARHVNHTVLCPDSTISLGECHHSFLGPFVGFNHLCAVVAVIWPEGRGNIAHGSKIGANHTGRLPDQEAFIGEGVFFGTGVVVKFPMNLTSSLYTLMATGISLNPQRLHFPFSLVVSPRDPAVPGIAGLNQILPAWVLAHSPYTVIRNEEKYQKRSKARRMPQAVKIFRPHSIDVMLEARTRLQAAMSSPLSNYTEREIPELGANFATHKTIEEGVMAYTMWIRRYALYGLLDRLLGPHDPQVWKHQSRVLRSEFGDSDSNSSTTNNSNAKKEEGESPLCSPLPSPPPSTTTTLLWELLRVEEEIVANVERCKARDDRRGATIMDDYTGNHAPAASDAVVVGMKAKLQELRRTVEDLLPGVSNISIETLEHSSPGESSKQQWAHLLRPPASSPAAMQLSSLKAKAF